MEHLHYSFFFSFFLREGERAFMSSFSLVPDKLSSRGEQGLGVTQHRGGWNTVCVCVRWISFELWPPPHFFFLPLPLPSVRLCRWSSAGRTAQSTSSEDGSPTGRDLARLPGNTGSVSGSGVWLCLSACTCASVCVCAWFMCMCGFVL